MHRDIIVVVERNDTEIGHKDVFSLMHHLGSLCSVSLGLDGCNEVIILAPVLDRVYVIGSNMLFRVDYQ